MIGEGTKEFLSLGDLFSFFSMGKGMMCFSLVVISGTE